MAKCDIEEELKDFLIKKKYAHVSKISFDDTTFSNFYINNDSILILDNNICEIINDKIFDYSIYTSTQNEIVQQYQKPFYRFVNTESINTINQIIYGDIDTFQSYGNTSMNRSGDNSYLESLFESAFLMTYGNNALSYLHKEYPILSINGTTFFIDYVVELKNGRLIGFELNGVNYHHPQLMGIDRYKKQLEKQNICNKLGIDIYRLSYDQCTNTTSNLSYIIKDIIKDFSFLKRKKLLAKRSFSLYNHQEGALDKLRKLHNIPNSSLVIVLPTASGKTQIIIEDLITYYNKFPNARVGIFSPTIAIKNNWIKTLSLNGISGYESEVGTYHLLTKLSREKKSDYFDYIICDEAHHAVANCTKNALVKFNPSLLVGLTATTERLDNRKLEDVFNSYSTNLTLQEAMENNIIAKARAYRIETNLDLSSVRYNDRNYNSGDLEKKISVDSRNILIGEVLEKYFNDGSLGVIFCVSIKHATQLSKLLNERFKLNSKAISSKDGKNAKKILEDFHEKKIQFLCVCDLLNEGWDEPDINVLVMARPTLSKVLYTQQLGRGLRKTNKKDEVYVIDVVDNYSYSSVPYSLHALFENPNYLPWGFVQESDNFRFKKNGFITINGLYETITNIVPININTLDKQLEGLFSLEATARQLFIGTNTFKKWIKKYDIKADKILDFGRNKLLYFNAETIEKIRIERGLPLHNDDTIRDDFFNFLEERNYTFSFKMVFLKESLLLSDCNGQIDLDNLMKNYKQFYINRINNKLIVDRKGCVYSLDYLNKDSNVKQSILRNPFEKFERKRFFEYNKDLNKIAINHKLWTKLSEDDISAIIKMMDEDLINYYSKLSE